MAKAKTRAPEATHREAEYLRELIALRQPVRIRLEDNAEYDGTIEYFDAAFVRLTRRDGPNLFVFKDEIKYLLELPGATPDEPPVD